MGTSTPPSGSLFQRVPSPSRSLQPSITTATRDAAWCLTVRGRHPRPANHEENDEGATLGYDCRAALSTEGLQ